LSLFHIVSLQLMVGVGLDYALFFARRGLDGEERARTFRTLITCNVMTLLSFGLLAFCRTPLLRGFGITVAVGVVGAICLAFLFAGPRPAPQRSV
jgi:predicted exporter